MPACPLSTLRRTLTRCRRMTRRIGRSLAVTNSGFSPPTHCRLSPALSTCPPSPLGNDDFVTMFSDVTKGIEELKEIPRSQRFLEHPSLRQLFSEAVSQGKTVRDRIICEAVELHGYTQKAVADHLQLHYSTVNRILTKQDSKKQQE